MSGSSTMRVEMSRKMNVARRSVNCPSRARHLRGGIEMGKNNGSKSAVERFLAKCPPGEPDDCWPFLGNINTSNGGYGTLYDDGRRVRAHRLAWVIANGRPVPTGM